LVLGMLGACIGQVHSPGVDRRINISMVLQEVGCGGLIRAGSGYGQVAVTCECGNEPSCSLKFGEFLGLLKTG
jgi:hypothetical protein